MMTVAPPVVQPSLGLMAFMHGVAAYNRTQNKTLSTALLSVHVQKTLTVRIMKPSSTQSVNDLGHVKTKAQLCTSAIKPLSTQYVEKHRHNWRGYWWLSTALQPQPFICFYRSEISQPKGCAGALGFFMRLLIGPGLFIRKLRLWFKTSNLLFSSNLSSPCGSYHLVMSALRFFGGGQWNEIIREMRHEFMIQTGQLLR